MEKIDIKIATVYECFDCEGTGKNRNASAPFDTCKYCNGDGKRIGKAISITELKELLNRV